MPHAKPYPTLEEMSPDCVARFLSRVKRGEVGECWPWTAALNGKGYGSLSIGGRLLLAPRVAYVVEHGSIPQHLCIRHKCDNPPCCNPNHLELGTHRQNAMDREERGRMPHYRGAENCNARLTRDEADFARLLHDDFGLSSLVLGQIFDLSQSGMSKVLRGVSYCQQKIESTSLAEPVSEGSRGYGYRGR